jgi:hypothetical protein
MSRSTDSFRPIVSLAAWPQADRHVRSSLPPPLLASQRSTKTSRTCRSPRNVAVLASQPRIAQANTPISSPSAPLHPTPLTRLIARLEPCLLTTSSPARHLGLPERVTPALIGAALPPAAASPSAPAGATRSSTASRLAACTSRTRGRRGSSRCSSAPRSSPSSARRGPTARVDRHQQDRRRGAKRGRAREDSRLSTRRYVGCRQSVGRHGSLTEERRTLTQVALPL